MNFSATIIESLNAVAQYSFTNDTTGFSEATYDAERVEYQKHKTILEDFFTPSVKDEEASLTCDWERLNFDFKVSVGYAIYMASLPYYRHIRAMASQGDC